MTRKRVMPEAKSYEEMAEFWDTHSVADYWDQTEPAEFEISEPARRRYMVPIDRDLLSRVQRHSAGSRSEHRKLSAYLNNPQACCSTVLWKSPARLRLRRPLWQRGPTDAERLARGFL
jgi:hypothetical protein